MSRTRTLLHFPRRERPVWKLTPDERRARGFCPHCLEHDPQGQHFTFGCQQERRAR